MTPITSILFDLDGTLLDTAPDMANTLNLLRAKHQLPPLPLSTLRPHVAHGARALIKAGLNVEQTDEQYPTVLEEYLTLYHQHLTENTTPFPQIEKVLDYIESYRLPWGIVTNKPGRFTIDLMKHLELNDRPACMVYGDSLKNRKPDPDQIIHACDILKVSPSHCLYIGDTQTDVIASKAAGTLSLVALYGYIHDHENPYQWGADGYVKEPIDIISWISNRLT